MATINLAPDNEYKVARERRQRWLFITAGGIVVILLALWGILWLLTQQVEKGNTEREGRLNTVNTEIAKQSGNEERIILFERRLQAMDILLQNHISWDPLLREIERLLPPPTTIDKASLQLAEGKITISGVTADLDQLAQTLASLSTKPGHATLFKQVHLTNTQRREDKVNNEIIGVSYTFGLEMTFDSAKLKNI